MSDNSSLIVCSYEYCGTVYNIEGDQAFHESLKKDSNYASEILQQLVNNSDKENIENVEQSNSDLHDDELINVIPIDNSTSSEDLTDQNVDKAEETSSSQKVPDNISANMQLSPKFLKSARGKSIYYHRQKQLDLDNTKIEMMKKLVEKLDENKNIQNKQIDIWNQRVSELTAVFKERNEILKNISNKLGN
ncbi:unnamed protein product [Pieris macdunnoughi]|uniref:Uncharacterized protein n=1 Tax=Pieris macdunnoughi TaxID=345717 RepID=A0A821UKM6_9NEOP|nr:unnamed protein product [Pieris macdunnoughi]